MKIGIVSNLYPPEARGGAELVAARIADALYERGHDVFVVTTQPFEGIRSLFPRIRERTLEAVYRFYPLNLYYLKQDGCIAFPIRALWHLIDLWGFAGQRAVRGVIRDEHPDLIITHNLKGIGVGIGREIQRQSIPHIHVLHDVQLSVPSGLLICGEESRWLNRSWLRRWYERATQRALGSPDLVISPSQFLVDFHRERKMFTRSRFEILANPMPPDKVPLRSVRISPRTQFLYVGQLEAHKGLRTLLKALEQMGEDVDLHIAGEGALSQYLQEYAERDSRIKFHGFVSLNHLIAMLRTTDAVVVPSICYENSPTVIYEAYLGGVPVIASNIGGIPELIEEGKTGLLVAPGDAGALAKAMSELHQNRDVWWARSAEIQAQAEQYSVKRYIDQLECYLKEMVET